MPETQAISCMFCVLVSVIRVMTGGGKIRGEEEKGTYNKSPGASKVGMVLAVDKHHVRHDPYVMLPPVPQLMPPLLLDDLALVDIVNRPEMPVGLVQENGLEHVLPVRYRRLIGVMVHPELMLIISAVERHFDLHWVFGVGMRVVHWSEARGLAAGTGYLVLGETDLVLLILRLGLCAEVAGEMSGVVFGKVGGVRMGDGDVVEEAGAAEDELFLPGGGLAK